MRGAVGNKIALIPGPRVARAAAADRGWLLASEVEAGEVEWLWRDMIPLGGITLIEGPPGCGKSTLTRDLVARVTSGRPLPFGSPPCPGGVLWCSSEEATDTVLVPSLRRAGSDDTQIHVLANGGWAEARQSCASMIVAHNVRALVFDNVAVFLGPEGDDYLSVQKALAPWGELAAETHTAIIGIRHTRKSGAASAVNAGIGSIGWAGVARATITVGEISHGRSACALAKANLGPKPDPYEFEISSEGVLRWGDRIAGADASDMTDAERPKAAPKKSAPQRLQELLRGGDKTHAEVFDHLSDLADQSIYNAASKLGVVRTAVGTTTIWRLP